MSEEIKDNLFDDYVKSMCERFEGCSLDYAIWRTALDGYIFSLAEGFDITLFLEKRIKENDELLKTKYA